MRTFLLALVVLAFAGYAYAYEPQEAQLGAPVVPPANPGEYVQPPNPYLWTVNASSGFNSYLIDDIPDWLYCNYVRGVDLYVAQWGGLWRDPLGIYIYFYYCECPPLCDPFQWHYIDWNMFDRELVYDDPGNFTCWWVKASICTCKHVEFDMSIGFQVVTDWGDSTPYCGVVMTDYGDVYGDCMAWWDGTYWGYVGYVDGFFADTADVAYSLVYETEPTRAEMTTWGQIKSLYR
jgi:hypothetical protein